MKVTQAENRLLRLPISATIDAIRCVCGVQFDSWKPEESYDHRAHICAAQREGAEMVKAN